jgi:hypothetical protein
MNESDNNKENNAMDKPTLNDKILRFFMKNSIAFRMIRSEELIFDVPIKNSPDAHGSIVISENGQMISLEIALPNRASADVPALEMTKMLAVINSIIHLGTVIFDPLSEVIVFRAKNYFGGYHRIGTIMRLLIDNGASALEYVSKKLELRGRREEQLEYVFTDDFGGAWAKSDASSKVCRQSQEAADPVAKFCQQLIVQIDLLLDKPTRTEAEEALLRDNAVLLGLLQKKDNKPPA